MRPERPSKKLHLLLLLLGLIACSVNTAHAEPPLPLDLDDSRSALAIGEEFERDARWLDAIRHYEKALERWPEDDELKYGRRRSRVHFRIERRYADQSFKQNLLGMSQSQALELFDDTSRRIRGSFVDSLSYLSLVAHGTESFYIALADAQFLEANLPPASTDQERNNRREGLRELRRSLRDEYWNKTIHNSQHARQIVLEVAQKAQQTLRISPSAVIMEYVFGCCNSLDDYSGFLTADRLTDLYSNIDGEFVGLGVEMKEVTGDGMLLVNVLPDSPASSGGLKKGDRIIGIDGANVREASIDEAAGMMRGPTGSRVKVEVERPSERRIWETVLIRRAVTVRSLPIVRMEDRELGVAYIQLAGFQKSTATELDEALAQLQREGMKALILDVRGNPGGLLTAAVEVLDRFIDDGVLVSTKGRTTDQNWTYRARTKNSVKVPLVVLTDGDSASASEIVAGAIRDHRRGTLVGRKTFGKWSVQSIFNIGRDTGLRLTTAKFYSPDGHTLSKIGVEPDVLVEPPTEHEVAFRGNASVDDDYDADIDKGLEVLKRQLGGF
jgi:carboxyl-terminal processing protease